MRPSKPLPRNIRLINRAILLVAVLFCILQCSRCAFQKDDENSENVTTKNEKVLSDSAATFDTLSVKNSAINSSSAPAKISVSDSSKKPDLSHVYAQRDTGLAHMMDTYLRRFHPDNALYLVLNAKTNEIIAWGERKDSTIQTEPDFLSQATFPAASLAKTITIAAAFESKRYSIHSEVPLIGSAHTLYKRQLKVPENYCGPISAVHLAYAKSFNPPIALIGMNVGAKRLKSAAEKFGFNRNFPAGIPERSQYSPPDSGYGLAEVACGFTQSTTLSPLQAAGIARAILMEKPFEIPWEKNGARGSGSKNHAPTQPIALGIERFSENAYIGLKQAMLATVTEGTSRKHISSKNISRKVFSDLDIGGKTGSLDGENPKGRYDWFMGFAKSRSNPDKAIAIVVMQVHGRFRTQVASQVAALLINYWAKEK